MSRDKPGRSGRSRHPVRERSCRSTLRRRQGRQKKALHLVGAGQTPQQRVELVALVAVERLEERVNLLFGLDDLLNPDVQNVVLLIFSYNVR